MADQKTSQGGRDVPGTEVLANEPDEGARVMRSDPGRDERDLEAEVQALFQPEKFFTEEVLKKQAEAASAAAAPKPGDGQDGLPQVASQAPQVQPQPPQMPTLEPTAPPTELPQPPVQVPQVPQVSQAPQTPQAVPAQVPDQTARLMDLVQQQSIQIQNLMAQLQQPQARPAQAPQDPYAPDPSMYNVKIPSEILQNIGSEDAGVQQRGLEQLVNGTGAYVHRVVMQEMDRRVHQIVESRVAAAMEQIRQAEQIRNDYYGTYPQHRVLLQNPATAQVISAVTAQVAQEMGAQGWSPILRDAVATRINQIFGQQVASGQQVLSASLAAPQPGVPTAQYVVAPAAGGNVAVPRVVQGGPGPQFQGGSRPGSFIPVDPLEADVRNTLGLS